MAASLLKSGDVSSESSGENSLFVMLNSVTKFVVLFDPKMKVKFSKQTVHKVYRLGEYLILTL